MSRIAILTPSISTGDAVSNDILGMHAALSKRGHEVQIFAEVSSISCPKTKHASKIRRFLNGEHDVLIYHYSMGWDAGLEILSRAGCKKVIRYHNVTPPEFFAGFSEAHVLMAHGGRKQLKDIANSGSDLFMSASAYNQAELIAEGAEKNSNCVVPPFHHIDRLNSVVPDATVRSSGETNVLMVGRVAPHKGHPELIEAFANYYYHYNSKARLFIVGKQDAAFESYYRMLRQMVSCLKLKEAITFTGSVTIEALKAYYLAAHVFLITSRHEGFCVPLVEAMAMKVPIVAYGCSAIPDTAGDAGLVWPNRDPKLAAESIHHIMTNRNVAIGLGDKGSRRYEQLFTNAQIEREFISAMDRVL